MHEDLSRDPWRDANLADALRQLGPEPPMDEVDWAGLRGRVEAAARASLAGRRRGWSDYLVGWARPVAPAMLAASAALAVALVALNGTGPADPFPATAPATALEEVLAGGAAADPLLWVALDDEPDALLEAALRWED